MPADRMNLVTGTLFYRERIALPPDAAIHVEIAYQPSDGAAPVVIGYQGFQPEGRQAPFEFSVPYDESEIDGRRNYFIQARIESTPSFVNAERVLVITHGHPTSGVNLLMRQAPSAPQTAQVTGTVAYRERIALNPQAVVTVRLLDVSRADAAAPVLGEQVYETAGKQVPLPFAVPYDAAAIDPRFSYSISARIEDGRGRLLFISDTANPVITRGNPDEDVAVWVRAVAAAS